MRWLRVRSAVPYRRFENTHDTERFYGMNEGYRRMLREQVEQKQQLLAQIDGMAVNPQQQQQQQQQQPQAPSFLASQRRRWPKRYNGYVFLPYESSSGGGLGDPVKGGQTPNNASSSSEDEND